LRRNRLKPIALCVALLLLAAAAASALDKTEVLVVYNKSFQGSKELAEYYAAKRGIPAEHVIAIDTSTAECIERVTYIDTIEKPIRKWIDGHEPALLKIKCILLMRGVPLGIFRLKDEKTETAMRQAERDLGAVEPLRKPLVDEKARLEDEVRKDPAKSAQIEPRIRQIDAQLLELDMRLSWLGFLRDAARRAWNDVTEFTDAAVDSELAVMYFENHRLKYWMPNLLHFSNLTRPDCRLFPKTFMTCRLDGPSDALMRRIIDDSIAAEQKGLEGVAYFDARNATIQRDAKGRINLYQVYEELIRRAAKQVEKTGMKVVLDTKPEVFPPNSCPNTALYCGWYSIAKYVPAFQWVKGAVGYHIASAEATVLRNPKTEVWCKRMIEEGVVATFGPVSEPYLHSFADPGQFFPFLLTGRYTVAESFWYTNPVDSWMITLICDPLYTPFRRNPKMTLEQLQEALKPVPVQ